MSSFTLRGTRLVFDIRLTMISKFSIIIGNKRIKGSSIIWAKKEINFIKVYRNS